MKYKKAILIYTITLWLFSENVYSQVIHNDSVFHAQSVTNTLNYYHKNIGYQSKLFNGKQYAGYPFTFKEGHPYFGSDEFSLGSIEYDHVFFSNVFLLYNEIEGVVLIRDQTHFTQLISEKIARFSIGKNQFIRIIENDTLINKNIKPGFYNILYSEKTKVLKQEVKLINNDISSASEGIKRSVFVKKLYFLEFNNQYFPIHKKKDILKIFSPLKSEITNFVKKNDLNFKADKDKFLTKITSFYDQFYK